MVHSFKESAPNSSPLPQLLSRIIPATVGSVLTALTLTPLDVVKIRQQQQSSANFPLAAVDRCRNCGVVLINDGLGSLSPLTKVKAPHLFDGGGIGDSSGCVSKGNGSNSFKSNLNSGREMVTKNQGVFRTLRAIYQTEGLTGIYGGLSPTLMMSVPSTVLYFTAYDAMLMKLNSNSSNSSSSNTAATTTTTNNSKNPLNPLLAGSSSRIFSATLVSPLELVKTLQATRPNNTVGVFSEIAQIARQEGFSQLYRGLAPTLLRDVPFSGIYWMTVESIKGRLNERVEGEITPLVGGINSFFSGFVGGSIATFITTPADLIKTRVQLNNVVFTTEQPSVIAACDHNGRTVATIPAEGAQNSPATVRNVFKEILEEGGVRGLWKGNIARTMRVGPACAIMIGTFEFGKLCFASK